MARPLKNNAAYFSHDADMRNNRKVKALRARFGLEGYAVWCMLLEALTDENGFMLKWEPLGIELISGDFGLSAERLEEIVTYMHKINLVQLDANEQLLACSAHFERMQYVISERERKRLWKESKRIIDDENTETAVDNRQIKGKEIKGKEIKEEREDARAGEGLFFEKNDSEAPTPSQQFSDVRKSIIDWASPDDWSELRKIAATAGFDQTVHGSVNDEVSKFISYHLAPDRPIETREAFIAAPADFFSSKAIKWFVDAKRYNRRKPKQSNAVRLDLPPRGYYTKDRSDPNTQNVGPVPISTIIRQ